MEFQSINLHDSILENISYNWGSKVLSVRGIVCGTDKSQFYLEFIGVRKFEVPHKEDWGASQSINDVSINEKGFYIIEMQSGDVISITDDKGGEGGCGAIGIEFIFFFIILLIKKH